METVAERGGGVLGRVASCATDLGSLAGWRRAGFLFLVGALAATGHAPVHAVPLFAAGLVVFSWMLDRAADPDGRRFRRLFATGWWFGFGYFLAGFYWITLSFFVVSPAMAAAAPFAAIGLAAGFAIFGGLTAIIYAVPRLTGPGRVVWFAIAWTAMEWMRGTILTGFPWNLAAYVWPGVTIGQSGAWIGAYGLSLVTVAILVSAAASIAPTACGFRPAGRVGIATVGMAAAVLVGLAGLGSWRLAAAGPTEFLPDIRLRLVQPSIPQHEKWKAAFRNRNFQAYLDFTRSEGFADITHVIWPETAAAMFLNEHPRVLEAIGAVTPPNGVLITGAVRREGGDGQRRLFNTLHAVDPGGRIVATYDKVHLVPFGEYMPLNNILPIGKLTGGGVNFSSGSGRRGLDLPGLPPTSPLICYEIIFPGKVVPADGPWGSPGGLAYGERPRWLLNLTNDAWFGTSSGPYQHLVSARIRSIEQGLPLVRAANTGISAVVDAYGRTVASVGLQTVGHVDSGLPLAIDEPTIFARWGQLPALGLVAAMLVLVVLFGRDSRVERG